MKSIKFKNKLQNINSSNKGITLISLTITIVILLILAVISINAIAGENGIIAESEKSKENAEMMSEKQLLELATTKIIQISKSKEVTKIKLQNQLDKDTSKGVTSIEGEEGEDTLIATFIESNRIYEVDQYGNVQYLGKLEELLKQAEIIASPEKNLEPELVQSVELTLKTPVSIADENITLSYAWTNSKNKEPEVSNFIRINDLSGTSRTRKTKVASNDTEEGEYYLWVKVKINGTEIYKTFGPYVIKNHTTLVATNKENKDTSYFLGSTEIKRNQIESITITKTIGTHTVEESNCWDVSADESGKYLAWYEDKDNDGYYEVTVAGKDGVVANSNSEYLFSYIGYNGDDTTVFYGLENLDTGLVTHMAYMFNSCSNAGSIDVSDFETKNVTNMNYMFYNCKNVKELDVSNFNTKNVTGMGGMFAECPSLMNLDVSNFDTSNVNSMQRMFTGCKSLTYLDVSNFDTSNVKIMGFMFYACSSLLNLDVSNFNTSNVTGMEYMFGSCSSLTTIDVSKFDTRKVAGMNYMFGICRNLKNLDVSNFDTSNVTGMGRMFNACEKLKSLDLSNFDTSNVKVMGYMFSGCYELTNLDVSSFDTSNVTDMVGIFSGCKKIKSLDLNGFKTSNITSMNNMFYDCRSLIELNISNFDTTNVTNIENIFYNCMSLQSLDIRNFKKDNLITSKDTFYAIPSTAYIYVSSEEMQAWAQMKTNRPTTEYIIIKENE